MTDKAGGQDNLEELLRMRTQLDQELTSKYSKAVTIIFTDIKGSTQYFETRGDLAGRAMVQAHNDLLFPIIKRHGGKIIKTIGDAIMASFEVPQDAVETAVDMQRELAGYNNGRESSEHIRIRIGINNGRGLVEEADVYGDVVNLAARVESLADGGEILVSEGVYMAVKSSDDLTLRYHSSAEVKGKSKPVDVYRVIWQEDLEYQGQPQSSRGYAVRGAASPDERVLTIDLARGDEKIKISASERSIGQEKAMRHYEEKDVDWQLLDRLCAEIITLLNRANKRGKVSREILVKLKEIGQQLYDVLLTPKVKDMVASSKAGSLIINMDDHLVHIPWENLFTGEEFLCQRFALGRIVATRQDMGSLRQRSLQRPLKMLILSDPKGDLQASYNEGVAIRDEMDKLPKDIIANIRTGPVTADYTKSKMRNYDILHYAGHADYDPVEPGNSGWLLHDDKVTARDVLGMAGSQPMPALVFSNACHSGQTGEWSIEENYGNEIYGLANAFLLTGVQHYIGTFWEVLDEPSAAFAMSFYSELMRGESIGEAVRLARLHLIKQYGEETIVWSSYMLYGDPTYVYKLDTPVVAAAAHSQPPPLKEALLAGGPSRAHAETISIEAPAGNKRGAGLYAGAAIALALLIAGGVYLTRRGEGTMPRQQPAPQTQAAAGGPAVQVTLGGQVPIPVDSRTSKPAAGAPAEASATGRPSAVEVREDPAKRERIRQLAKELVARYKERGGAAQPAVQGNRPITVAFMGFSAKGPGSQDGEDQYLLSAIQDKVVSGGKVQVVERDLLEGVLDELNLSTSDLADQKVALRLGKILAARYIGTGTLYRFNGEYRVSLRLIDTETSAVTAVLNETGKGRMDADKVSASLASAMMDKLAKENN